SLIVDIYPPSLHAAGLDAALADLLAGAANRGLRTRLSVVPDPSCDAECEALIYRVAQEAVRNAIEHARANEITIDLARTDGRVEMEVRDDAPGVPMGRSMPGMDGIEAGGRVLSSRADAQVVVLTAFSDRERIRDGLDAGAGGCLLKDPDPGGLLKGVRAAARGQSPVDPRVARV